MREREILDAVEHLFAGDAPCVMLRQVTLQDRRIDGLVVYGQGYRVAIEAKSSRADFRTENDAKRAASEDFAHACYYAAPVGVVDIPALPDGWGLIHVHPDRPGVVVVKAGQRNPARVSQEIVAGLIWRTAHAERRAVPGSVAALRLENERLVERLGNATSARERERDRADDAATQVIALMGEQVCADCREPIKYTRTRSWTHVGRSVETRCARVRAEAQRKAREAATGASYSLTKPPPIMPESLAKSLS